MFNVDFDINKDNIFKKHEIVLLEGTKKTKEILELRKILEKNKNKFKNIHFLSSIEEVEEILSKNNSSVLFLDKENSKSLIDIKNKFINIKIIFVVKNITNKLFTLKPDEFIFNPSEKKEITILKLIYKNLMIIENNILLSISNEKIIEQQKNIELIFNLLSNNSLITKTDNKGKIIFVNDIFKKISGFKEKEIIGKTHNIIKHPETTEKKIKEIWKTISSKKVWSGIIKNKSKENTDYIVETKIIPEINKEGEVFGYLSVQYDITELVLKKELAQAMLDEQSNPILIGQYNKIKNSNKEFNNTFNDINIRELLSKKKEINKLDLEKLENGENISLYNISLLTKDKEIKNFNIFQKIVEGPFGKYFIRTFIDITQEQKEILNAKYEAHIKSNFLATMSHEIRTPLNGMIPYINLLLETNLNNEQEEFLSIIKNSSENLLKIINDILDFSKIEAGKLNIENILFDPIKEFKSVIELYKAKIEEKNINLDLFIEPNLQNFYGDPLRIKQIINNLLSNSIKFTPINGTIKINIEYINSNINISIKDNGCGIPKEIQKNIFNSFTQADNSISRNYGGTGLGLSISQNLAKLMNSNIYLISEENKGSEFYFSLSLKEEKKVEKEENIEIEKTNKYKSYKAEVLIAEDNITNQKLIKTILNKVNIEPKIVENGELAYYEFLNKKYDLVFLDIHMPVMNGLEALKKIRTYEIEQNIEKTNIIALTADAIKSNEDNFINNGFTDFISKPINISFFFKKIDDYLSNFEQENIEKKKKEKMNIKYYINKISKELDIDDETSNMLLEDFLENWKKEKNKLLIAIRQKDFLSLKEISHSLKGAAGSLLLNDLYESFKFLETKGSEKKLDNVFSEYKKIKYFLSF